MSRAVTQEAVLHFWFEESTPSQWFKKDSDFDEKIRTRFSTAIESALEGKLDHWTETLEGCVALILVLDQFTRNAFRDTPKAFAGDKKALSLSKLCQERGYLTHPDQDLRHFMLIPMMHSEDITVQEASLPLFKDNTDERTYSFAVRHRDLIEMFGRYPHRNRILGRKSTEEEEAFLEQPGSGF